MTTPFETLQHTLQAPEDIDTREDTRAWFDAIADVLLNGAYLVAGGERHRLVEVEFYYHGGGHLDPFTHCDDVQKTNGRWYFHRARGTYKSGSFKGLDLTFGVEGHHGGVLIRSIERADGTLIDGPCLCVNHLLDITGQARVADLDAAIDARAIWDTSSPLHFVPADDDPAQRDLLTTARIGLTLKRSGRKEIKHRYIMRPYRYLSRPRDVKKGRILAALALHTQGLDADAIRAAVGSPKRSINNYVEHFTLGATSDDFSPFVGKDLKSADLAQLHGTWHNVYGVEATG